MSKTSLLWLSILLLLVGSWGCGDDDEPAQITGPEFAPGPGRAYEVETVVFTSIDGVQISALLGAPQGDAGEQRPRPAIILVHDVFGSKEEWIFFFENLLREGYLVLAIDLRGHGQTPLPDDDRPEQSLSLEDLERSYRDVQAALDWLETRRTQVDASRIGIIGNGMGGNVAYVSMGVFPGQISAGVALSPGLWDSRTLSPLVVGEGLQPFTPHSLLFMVGSEDIIPLDDTGQLEFSRFATDLAARTSEPKTVKIFSGSADHGLDLLNNPEAVQLLLAWLATYL